MGLLLLVFSAVGVQAGRDSSEPGSKRVRTEVKVFIEEHFDEPREHRAYEQPWSVEFSNSLDKGRKRTATSVVYNSRCTWLQEEPLLPPLPAGSPLFLLSISGSVQEVHVTGTFLAGSTVTSGNPRSDPVITKPSEKNDASASESGRVEDSGQNVMVGPTLSVPLKEDVTEWDVSGWLPRGTSLGLYARALFGQMEVFDVETDVELYSAGVQVGVPILGSPGPGLRLSVPFTVGPGFFRTDIGEATGIDAGLSLQADWSLGGNLSLVILFGGVMFYADDLFTWGPVANLGVNLGW